MIQPCVIKARLIGKDIIPQLLADHKTLYAYKFKGYWKDVGTIDSLWEANMDLLAVSYKRALYDRAGFYLGSMSNSGIDRIQVYIRRKPRSLVEHLGTGRHDSLALSTLWYKSVISASDSIWFASNALKSAE